MSDDARLIESLIDDQAVRPSGIAPGESLTTRALVLALAPAWLTALMIAVLMRALRGRLPLIVLHERVSHRRVTIGVPKIATAKVASNERRFGGLVEHASGPPVELEVDHATERWLRDTGADELPQLMLVLAGKMRLVGPRPVTPSELDEMAQADREVGIDHLQPGLIGLWQVLDRHGYELDERRDLDIAMIDNWSPRLQRRIIAIAFRQMLDRVRRLGSRQR